MIRYENLAHRKKQEAKRAAEKAVKKAAKVQANGTRRRAVSLPTLLPPHAPRLGTQPPGTVLRRPLYEYETAFLVPVPLFFGAGLGLGLGGGLEGCVAPGGFVIGPNEGFNAACGGTPRVSICLYV